MDSSTALLFGRSIGCLEQSNLIAQWTEFVQHFDYIAAASFRRLVLGQWAVLDGTLDRKTEKEASQNVHDFVSSILQQARFSFQEKLRAAPSSAPSKKTNMFFDSLVRDTTIEEMKDHMLTLLIAARDTTAGYLSQLWMEISRHPDVFAKLKEEVETVLHGDLPDLSSIPRLQYLDMCIKETLRLYPSVPMNMRFAKKASLMLPCESNRDADCGRTPLYPREVDQMAHPQSTYRRVARSSSQPTHFIGAKHYGVQTPASLSLKDGSMHRLHGPISPSQWDREYVLVNVER
jgi:hypothetical protein